jgi:ABC-type nitrate/sulfonate/bicarbonate transport system substrate-binding protein
VKNLAAVSRRCLASGTLAVGFAALMISCGLVATNAAAQSPAGTRPVGSITLGWVKSTANLMAFIAPQISEKHGLKIESLNFNTAVDISTAMISGQIDIGLLTPIHLIRAIDTNVDFVQIAGNTRGNTGIIAAKKLGLAQDDWENLKKLTAQKKLKIASSRGSINEMLAIAEFAKHGINVDKDLDLVNIANFAQHPQALRSGDFDMIVTLEPLATISLVEGTGTLFARPYSTAAGDLNTNYCVRREWLLKNAEKAKAYVATLAEASARLGNDKGAEMEAAIKLTGLKPEVLTTALSNSRYELRNGLAQMQELARLAQERRYTSRNVAADLPKHVDGQFLKAAGIDD